MKRFALVLLCVGIVCISIPGQTTRPRVIATPTPKPPVLGNDPQMPNNDGRGAPVLQNRGGSNSRTSPQPTPPASDDESEVIKVETNLVTMPVSVLDRDGRFVTGLQERDFKIYENGVEQEIDFFQSVEQPFTVVLMIDVSPSTAFRIDEIHDAAISFVDQLRPNDRVMVVAFDDTVRVLSRPTNDRRALAYAIRQARFGDGTSLYEAVDHVLDRELSQIEGRKAIVLFTDGVDTTSRRANYQSTVLEAEESDALIYPIRYNTQRDMGGGGGIYRRRPSRRGGWGDILGTILSGGSVTMGGGSAGSSSDEYEKGRQYLETLAQNTGGRKFEADSVSNLDAAFAGIAEELRRQYSLGYYPEVVGRAGDRKQIKVRVMRPNLVVRSKTSYIVGSNENRLAGK